jgi:hypothetical protein
MLSKRKAEELGLDALSTNADGRELERRLLSREWRRFLVERANQEGK